MRRIRIALLVACIAFVGAEPADDPVAAIVKQLQAARRIGNDEMSTTRRFTRPTPRYAGRFSRFEQFDGGDYAGWTVIGHAFGDAPTAEGEWDSLGRGPRTIEPGVAHSGLLARQLRGTLRSREFVIRQPFVDYLVAGSRGRVRLIVVNGPSVDERIDTTDGAFEWRRRDVSHHRGRRARIEIEDDAVDGWVAVDEIVFTDGSSPPPAVPPEMPTVDALASSPALARSSAILDAVAATLPRERPAKPTSAPARTRP